MGDISVPSDEIHPVYIIIVVAVVVFIVIVIFLELGQFKLGIFLTRILRRVYEDLPEASTRWVTTHHWCRGLQRAGRTSLRCSSCRWSFCEDEQCKTPDPALLQ